MQQAIIWANVDPHPWLYVASLGHNELIGKPIWITYPSPFYHRQYCHYQLLNHITTIFTCYMKEIKGTSKPWYISLLPPSRILPIKYQNPRYLKCIFKISALGLYWCFKCHKKFGLLIGWAASCDACWFGDHSQCQARTREYPVTRL